METGNLIHLGAELVVQMLMLYSTSPSARRLTAEMLTGDPFNIDVKLDDNCTNRNVEILNVYLKTMGLKITFTKVPKKREPAMLVSPMDFNAPADHAVPAFIPTHPDEYFDINAEVERLIEDEAQLKHAMEFFPMEFLENLPEFVEEVK